MKIESRFGHTERWASGPILYVQKTIQLMQRFVVSHQDQTFRQGMSCDQQIHCRDADTTSLRLET